MLTVEEALSLQVLRNDPAFAYLASNRTLSRERSSLFSASERSTERNASIKPLRPPGRVI